MKSIVEIGTIKDVEPWVQLRAALWPHHMIEDHRAELVRTFLSESGKAIAFIARNSANEAVGFAEASLRHDYVNGCRAVRPFYSSKGFTSGPLTGDKGLQDCFAMPLPNGESRLDVLNLALTRR